MKKISILLLFFICTLHSYPQGLRFSVIAEPQLSWFNSNVSGVSGKGTVPGINAGMKMEHFFSDYYAFSTGLTVSHLGGKLEFSEGAELNVDHGTGSVDPGSTVTYNLRYLTLPIGMEFISREIGYTTIFANLGLGAHLNIAATADDSGENFENIGIGDEIRPFSMSYHIGGGIYYSLGGQTAIIAGLSYRHNFTDLISPESDYNAFSNAILFRTGILF